MIRNAIAVALIAFGLVGCANIQKVIDVANATVPPTQVIQAANGFNILKGAATRYGQYCVQQKMAPAICSADTRRIVIKSVRAGTNARDRMTDSIVNGTPAAASVYNLLVGAIDDLKNSPVHSPQFGGIIQ